MAVIDDVVAKLRTQGYVVHTTLQEKQIPNMGELIVVLENFDFEVETTMTYIASIVGGIIFSVTDVSSLIPSTVDLMRKVEIGFGVKNGFTFAGINVERMGLMYKVEIFFEYREMINLF